MFPNRLIALRERVFELCKRIRRVPIVKELIIDARGPFLEVQEEFEPASAWIIRRQNLAVESGDDDRRRVRLR
jgi:hypothetical protein